MCQKLLRTFSSCSILLTYHVWTVVMIMIMIVIMITIVLVIIVMIVLQVMVVCWFSARRVLRCPVHSDHTQVSSRKSGSHWPQLTEILGYPQPQYQFFSIWYPNTQMLKSQSFSFNHGRKTAEGRAVDWAVSISHLHQTSAIPELFN